MILLPKCRAFYVVLEKGHGAGKKGMALEKRAWRGAMLKLPRGNTMSLTCCDNMLYMLYLGVNNYMKLNKK